MTAGNTSAFAGYVRPELAFSAFFPREERKVVSHPRPSLIAILKSKLLNGQQKQTDFVIVASERAKGTESELRNPSQTSVRVLSSGKRLSVR